MFSKTVVARVLMLSAISAAITASVLWYHSLGTAVCYPAEGSISAYCDARGTIQSLSSNTKGMVTVKLAKPFSVSDATKHGLQISRGDAMVLMVDASPEKQEMLAQLHLAHAHDKFVVLHAHGTNHGMLELDNIWVKK